MGQFKDESTDSIKSFDQQLIALHSTILGDQCELYPYKVKSKGEVQSRLTLNFKLHNLSPEYLNPAHNANSDTRKIEFRQSPAKLNHNIDLSTHLTILVEKFDVLICAKLV